MYSRLRITPIIGLLAAVVAIVALACAGDSATPTSEPTTAAPPTATSPAPVATAVPEATSPAPVGATATAVPEATSTAAPVPTTDITSLPWIERLMVSPGYKAEWGTPKTGGILQMGMPKNPGNIRFHTTTTTPGPHASNPYNGLLRFDPWVGLDSLITDMAKSWNMSDDGLTLTLELEEGILFQDNPYADDIPASYNGGLIRGDEFTCEDVKASVEFYVTPPAHETRMSYGPPRLGHMNSVTCPAGVLGYTAVMNFDMALSKTMTEVAEGHMAMMDKEYIEWMNELHPAFRDNNSPERFLWLAGYGAFVPVEFQPDIITKYLRNPTYWREGLPLLDGIDLLILKDGTTRFTALATGQVQYFGHGSYGMLPGQVAQAQRDFADKITVHTAQHNFGYGIQYNFSRSPWNIREVRQAIQLAVNRDDWLLFRESGSYAGVLLVGSLAPGTPYSFTEEELRTWPGMRQPKDADIEAANVLLDGVFGPGERFSSECNVNNTQNDIDMCLFFMDQMARSLEIDLQIEIHEWAVGASNSLAGLYDARAGSNGYTGTGDPDEDFFGSNYLPGATNPSTIRALQAMMDAEPVLYQQYMDMGVAQSTIMDVAERKAAVQEMEKLMFEELILETMLGWNNMFFATTPELRGYVLFKFQGSSIWSNYERLWLNFE